MSRLNVGKEVIFPRCFMTTLGTFPQRLSIQVCCFVDQASHNLYKILYFNKIYFLPEW